MARVFVSHASADRALAGEVYRWLVEAGHEVFLDQDLRDGIALGEEWERRLHERLTWANAVVCVVTSAYLDSTWCAAEIGIARSRGSQLLPLCAEPGVAHPLLTSVQHRDFMADPAAARAAVITALHRVDATWPDDRSPFPGLRPFDTDRHQVFFGRTDEVEHLAELLRSPAERAEGAALLVVGPSGCGKSSLVRAGLLPMMARESGWLALPPILPGTDPVAALARELAATARRSTLDWTVDHVHHQLDQHGLTGPADELLLADPAGPQQRLLIVVDQFEELLTQTTPTERARFVELLRPALTGPVRVVATLRPEFLDQLLIDPELATLPTRTYTLRPLRREALRAVIQRPARLAGIDVDDSLVDRLVDDTDSGEALPLLAFILAQLAEGIHRDGRLSRTRYDRLGGVQGALTRQADTALTDALTAGGRSREQVIAGLLRLVTVDEQGRPTRWRVNRDELPTPVVTELDAFVTRRLLTTDEGNGSGVVGVAHEAFLSTWPPLTQAIAANVSALRARRAVEHAATEWNEDGRPPTRLWGGGQLAATVTDTGARIHAGTTPPARQRFRWLPQRHRVLVTDRVELSPQARDFLHTSIRSDRYRRQRTTTILSVLLILALVAAGVAIDRQRIAEQRQRIAIAGQLVGEAEAARRTDLHAALQLGLAAHRIHPDDETRSSLLNTVAAGPYAGTLTGHSGSVASVAFAPDGRTLATGSEDNTVILWDLTDRAQPRRLGSSLTGHTGPVNLIAWNPDGRTLFTGGDDHTVILWDLTDRAQPRRLESSVTDSTGPISSMSLATDGHTLATVSESSITAILWDVTDRAQPRQLGPPLSSPTDRVNVVAFTPQGRMLATSGATTVLWDLTTPAQPRPLGPPLTGHANPVDAVAFAPDGRTLVVGSNDGSVILWDVTDPVQPQLLGSPLAGHSDSVMSVSFAPDGRTLVTGSFDRTAMLWDVTDPIHPQYLRPPLTGHSSRVWSVAFAPDGRTLATGSEDKTVILWDLTDRTQPRQLGPPLTGHTGPVVSVAFSPDGRTLATGNADATVILWDLTDRAQPRQLGPVLTGHIGGVFSMSFAPGGRTLATGSADATVILWDLTDRTQPRRLGPPLTGHTGQVQSVAFTPDGRTLATGSVDGSAILWDLTDPAQPSRPDSPRMISNNLAVLSVAFSPDGRTLAISSGSDVTLWDPTDPVQPRRLGPPLPGLTSNLGVLSVAFAPDGRTLVTGNQNGTASLWDLADLNQVRDHVVERACSATRGGLDRDEWARYVQGLPYQDSCPA